ncbi:oligosaccharide flippase family protein [Limnohabitans sp. Jir72]|uniref:oligosaccharide flippase family protein n=1 Tax=Limnohabitans sp. Jir72 TaxID=1977909 RepID=UPI000D3BE01E|nr:oligosaccharide flippase family protein [Limnohabitans sp. Jir72]PUE28094.1 hypothetical protein B9Z52_14560 [Limnohabitans sp. Jir72]
MKTKLNIQRNVKITVLAFIVNIILTFVGFRLVVQHGGTEALGLWSMLTASIYIIRLGDVGVGSATERVIALLDVEKEPLLMRRYLDTALVLNGLIFIVLTGIIFILMNLNISWLIPGSQAEQSEGKKILPIILMAFILTNLGNIVLGGLRGLHFAWQGAYFSIFSGSVQLILIILLVPKIGVEGLAWAQLSQALILGLLAWLFFNRHIQFCTKLKVSSLPRYGSCNLLKELFGFSIRVQAVNLANGFFEPISKIMVGHSGGMALLGLYEMAFKIVALPRNAVISGVHSLTPAITRLMRQDQFEAINLYKLAYKRVTFGTSMVLGSVILSAPLISIITIGTVNSRLICFIAIIAVGFLINSFGAPAYALGLAAGVMKFNLISSILSLCCVIFFGFVLKIIMPIYGTALACAIGLSVGGLFIRWKNEKLLAVEKI